MSQLDSTQRPKKSKAAAIQEAARKSLPRWLRPLSAFVLDCGLSISEVNSMLRMVVVHTASTRQLEHGNRVNISGIAAITGIPRGEVSRILNSSGNPTIRPTRRHQIVTSRILSAWHRNPQFLTADHRPRVLKIFGGGRTFESLVRIYGQGIPVRAILDELTRVGAIQLTASSQKILPKMTVPINPSTTHKKIRNFDTATEKLFSDLMSSDDAFVERRVSVLARSAETRAQLVKHSLKSRRNFQRNR